MDVCMDGCMDGWTTMQSDKSFLQTNIFYSIGDALFAYTTKLPLHVVLLKFIHKFQGGSSVAIFFLCVAYLTSPGRPTDIGLQLSKACYPCTCSR